MTGLSRHCFFCAVALHLLWAGGAAFAAVIRVGPSESIKTIAEAAKLAKDDDVVEIAPGHYDGDVATWTQKRLTIRGVGPRPVLNAAGKSAQGKAIWVFRDGDFSVSNIEFRGARVDDGNGAGIRFEKGRLLVRQCAFFDNQMGLLTANFADAELTVEDSEFGQAPHQVSPLPHLLYAGRIALLRVSGSRFGGGFHGHLVKSRARVSDLRYNLIVDGPGGQASYEADFPNGGDVTLVGNVIAQSRGSDNLTVVAYAAEGGAWGANRLRMVHNTLYSEGPRPAWFLHVFADKLGSPPDILTHNNLLAGVGLFNLNLAGQHAGNQVVPVSVLADPDGLDFSLAKDSWLRGRVSPLALDPDGLQPTLEQRVPGRLSPIADAPEWVPGAVQAPTLERR